MAGTLGVDLEEEALRGHLPFDDIADMVLRCTGCSSPGKCTHWMDSRADDEVADTAPSYCRNAETFAALKS